MDGSNAFNNPTSGKIDQQRKILEDLERQKKNLLLKSGSSGSVTSVIPSPAPSTPVSEGAGAGGRQSAVELANKTSLGYFIHQDSAFGNVILPVIPRLPQKTQK